jgi:hypothetical protein
MLHFVEENMKVDLERLTQFLNESAEDIRRASDIVASDPAKAIDFIPSLMTQFQQFRSIGSLPDIKTSIENADRTENVHAAIKSFLDSTKEAQEKVGPIGAALFGTTQFRELRDNLEQVKRSLEKGKKVDQAEEGSGI